MATLDNWVREFLSERRYAALATHNGDGSIHVTPVWYLFESEKFYVGSSSLSRKARNVLARPNATILVDARKPGTECWVYASGNCEILMNAESREITSRILHRYLTVEAMSDPRIGPGFEAADDITICLDPLTWRTWRASDVDEQFFGGVLGGSPRKWFRPAEE